MSFGNSFQNLRSWSFCHILLSKIWFKRCPLCSLGYQFTQCCNDKKQITRLHPSLNTHSHKGKKICYQLFAFAVLFGLFLILDYLSLNKVLLAAVVSPLQSELLILFYGEFYFTMESPLYSPVKWTHCKVGVHCIGVKCCVPWQCSPGHLWGCKISKHTCLLLWQLQVFIYHSESTLYIRYTCLLDVLIMFHF